jgi:general secretion pathway protein E
VARLSDDASLVVKLVNSTLYDALKARASDIHFETDAAGLRIQYRIDGVLNLVSRRPGGAGTRRQGSAAPGIVRP